MAELTLRAVIKWYPIKNISKNVVFVLFHVFLQVGIKQVIRYETYTGNRIYRYIITGNDRTGGLTRESRTLPNVAVGESKYLK